jgi:hypothetical protein
MGSFPDHLRGRGSARHKAGCNNALNDAMIHIETGMILTAKEDLLEVPGIGSRRAELIYDVLHAP